MDMGLFQGAVKAAKVLMMIFMTNTHNTTHGGVIFSPGDNATNQTMNHITGS